VGVRAANSTPALACFVVRDCLSERRAATRVRR
jgi:hypothetical protein